MDFDKYKKMFDESFGKVAPSEFIRQMESLGYKFENIEKSNSNNTYDPEVEFTLKRYDNIDDLMLAALQVDANAEEEGRKVTLEDLKEATISGLNPNEEEIEFSYEQQKEGIELMGHWGWVDEHKVIHYWISKEKQVPIEDLIHFFAHEIGHRTGKELEDDFQEEMRAEGYGHAATLAYKLAKQHFDGN
jgi:hypothetical protein